MSISYHGVVGHTSRVTLPSYESVNILRDPPKSIQTRKIDKVGETSEITQMIQESGDRSSEVIKIYARGINPMVAVSFDNNGNNGGQRSGQSMAYSNATQSFLPYRVMRAGAFRPPVRTQESLLPLSRQPRVWTSSFTQPGFADFSKRALYPSPDTVFRNVKAPEKIINTSVAPTATYSVQAPLVEPYEVRYVIKNPVKVYGDSGIASNRRVNGEMGDPVKQIVSDPLRPDVNVMMTSEISRDVDISNFSTEKYTRDILEKSANSNLSQNIQILSIDELLGEGVVSGNNTKEQMNISYAVPKQGNLVYDLNDDVRLERVLPQYDVNLNKGLNIHKRNDDFVNARVYSVNRPAASAVTNNIGGKDFDDSGMNRTYNLRPTINAGSFDISPTLPVVMKENQDVVMNSEKRRMRQLAYDMQADRDSMNPVFVRVNA